MLVIPLILSACSKETTPSTTTSTDMQLSGTITESGSTTVQPLAEELRDAFQAKYQKVTVTIQGGGSGVGIKAAQDGTVDIGAASRELTDAEKGTVVETVLARDGIAIVVNPAQKNVTNLTKAQVKDIFSGKITNWKNLGGDDKAIVLVSREEGSGTRAAFQELILGKDVLIADTAILQSSNGAIRTTVASNPYAISFLSFGYIDSSVKALNLEGVAATVDNAKNGSYPAVRPLLFLTKTQPTGLVKTFIDFCLSSEGQAIVAKDYITAK
ncbi:MAG: phosphate ABC transporter substrate-binding protein [Dehalococcoidales bacterium]|nr:phosphate ABC transporter substrate-binding protein [Dehalococcoidales bacterium]